MTYVDYNMYVLTTYYYSMSTMTDKAYQLYTDWRLEDKILFDKFAEQECLDVIKALAVMICLFDEEKKELVSF